MSNEDVNNTSTGENNVPVAEGPKNVIYAVAYARVSTDDKDQNPESQLRKIREYAKNKNIEIVREFQDKSTGKNINRDGFYTMMGFLQSNRKVSMCIALDSDRISRDMGDSAQIIEQMNEMGVNLVYVLAEFVDLSTPEGRLINSIKSYSDQNYVSGLSEKIKTGMERARAEGKHIGRPLKRSDKFSTELLLAYAAMGYSLRDVANVHDCSRVTITRRLQDEGKLDEFKRIYQEALASGKKGPALRIKKYKPKKEKPAENEQGGD